jgi:hypothetical protein
LASARQTDIGRGEFEERSRVSLHEYLREWIDRYQGTGRRGFREETRSEYRGLIEKYALRYFPAKAKLSDITPSAIAGFVGWLCDGCVQAQLDHRIKTERDAPSGNPIPRRSPPAAPARWPTAPSATSCRRCERRWRPLVARG